MVVHHFHFATSAMRIYEVLPEFVAGCQLQQPPSSWPRSCCDARVVRDDVRSNLRLTHPEPVKHGAPAKSAQQTKAQLLEMTGRCKSMFNSSCVNALRSVLPAVPLHWLLLCYSGLSDHGCSWANLSNAHGSTLGPHVVVSQH